MRLAVGVFGRPVDVFGGCGGRFRPSGGRFRPVIHRLEGPRFLVSAAHTEGRFSVDVSGSAGFIREKAGNEVSCLFNQRLRCLAVDVFGQFMGLKARDGFGRHSWLRVAVDGIGERLGQAGLRAGTTSGRFNLARPPQNGQPALCFTSNHAS
jgi:hypothetical protein